MDDEILLAVPAVILLVAGAAATATGEVTLAQLAPGALAMGLFAVAMYGVARYRSPGDVDAGDGREPTATVRSDASRPAPGPRIGTTDGGTDRPAATPADTRGLDPVVRRAGEERYDPVGAADGLRKGVLVGEAQGARNLAIRRFTLAPGGSAPKHTNEIEHEQYVLEGRYTVGIGEEEYEVSAGDSLFVPAGVVHWYRNDGPDQGAFICAVPMGDDSIDLLEDE
jgi:quercetin dioxygenase-like cupin family protein